MRFGGLFDNDNSFNATFLIQSWSSREIAICVRGISEISNLARVNLEI
jgi:hypothetical protein